MAQAPQFSTAKGEIAPEVYGRIDTAAYGSALATARNVVVRAFGSIYNRPGLTFIGPVKDHTKPPRIIQFQFNTSDTYLLEFGNLYMRVIRNDAHVTETPKTITAVTAANPPVVTSAAHGFSNGDEVFVTGVVGMTRLNGRRFNVKNVTTNTFTLADQVTSVDINATAYAAYVSGGTAARIYTIVTPYTIDGTSNDMLIKFVQSADTMTMVNALVAPQELKRSGHAAWAFTTPTFAPSIAAPATLTVGAGGGAVTRNYAVTASAAVTFEESLPTLQTTTTGATPSADVLSWPAVTGAAKYSIYLQQNGVYGWLGDSDTLTFTNGNLAPDLTTSPPAARNPFVGAGNYPGAVSYYQQRRVFGGSLNAPDTTWYSQVASAANMSSSSPVQADDAITAALNSRQVNDIRHLVPGDDLLIYTSGSEWQVNSGTDSSFSATTLKQHPQSAWGCSQLPPIVVGKTILYVVENGASVRSMGFSWQVNGYTGDDVSLLSSHLFERYNIVDWTFARSPDPVAHVVRSDGQACAMTFNQEQQMVAWTRWDTRGKFERVASLRHPSTEIDEPVYFVVKRVINGNIVRYIERTHSRRFFDIRDAFFVDAGISYDSPVTVTGVSLANPAVVTAAAHGFTTGDKIDLFCIKWTPTWDEDGNEIQPGDMDDAGNVLVPNQLNGGRYTITVIDANTFSVPVDSTGFLAYVENGTARKAAQTITQLDHLEGQEVVILADGSVVEDLTVTNGQVVLPYLASRAHIGLPYIADVETLNLETPGAGTIQGAVKTIDTVLLRMDRSRGLLVGPNSGLLTELKQRQYELMGAPTNMLSGDVAVDIPASWNSKGRIFLRQKYPLPMNILAIIPDILVGT